MNAAIPGGVERFRAIDHFIVGSQRRATMLRGGQDRRDKPSRTYRKDYNMNRQPMSRRGFLKTTGVIAAGACLGGPALARPKENGAPHAAKLGWKLGCQAWTFNNETFYDAIQKTASLGLHYIEGFPGQRIRPGDVKDKLGDETPEAVRKEVKKHLADHNVRLNSFGVGGYSRPVFEFAKDMGIQTIVSEPPPEAFDELDKLCEEYQINVALHNHPRPSRYWNPDFVLKVCKDHSKRIGACCDIGHWLRSGIDPLAALKKLEGRIIEFHFKDLNKASMLGHDVPWGTGKADVKALLTEVRRQGIKPFFAIEYEYNFGHSMPELVQCVAYFDHCAAELANT
jgi:sugar phosphate isomerase/epimerase